MERFIFDAGRKKKKNGGEGWTRSDDEAGAVGQHYESLYDENEDKGGEKTNLATGESYDNSTYTGMEDMREVEADKIDAPENDDVDELSRLVSKDPEAKRWLDEHRDRL